jgi:CubicO group peptidase (beta-lactamase class C family)
MRLLSGSLGLFFFAAASLHGLAVVAQNCPFLGPAYPPATNITAPAFVSTGKTFEAALASALAEGKMAGNDTFWAVQVYTLGSKKPIYETYHSATIQKDTNATNPAKVVGPDTVFRVYSISKLITVYAILAKVGDKYWDEPVAKYIPELSRLQPGNPVREVRWDEVTIGSLASLMSGVGRDCELLSLTYLTRPLSFCGVLC